MIIQFVGVDPGQVHTGVVSFEIDPSARTFVINPTLVQGLDVATTKRVIAADGQPMTYIEAYRPRSHFGGDREMQQFIHDLGAALRPNSRVIDNTGVKQVVTKKLLEALGVWNFPQRTHHQDLRSAARIGIYGALKNDEFNQVLYELVFDHAYGNPWGRR